jgi:hypothetical protein
MERTSSRLTFALASLTVSLVLSLGATPVEAAERMGIDETSYSAPDACESASSFRERLLTSTPIPPPYVIRVTETENGFEGRARWIERGAGTPSERAFVSSSCDDVTRGLALAIGLGSAPERANAEARPTLGPAFVPTARDVVSNETPNGHRSDLLLTAGLSIFGDRAGLGGVSLEEKVLYRRGMLGLGGIAEQSSKIFDYQAYSFAPAAGVFAPGPKWLRAGVLGTVGARIYQNADGIGWFGSCPCASGTLAFTGARAIVGVDFWYLHVGAHAFADTDLGTLTRTVQNESGGAQTLSVGTYRYGGGLAIGPRFDL